jgi:hypothetical protein
MTRKPAWHLKQQSWQGRVPTRSRIPTSELNAGTISDRSGVSGAAFGRINLAGRADHAFLSSVILRINHSKGPWLNHRL